MTTYTGEFITQYHTSGRFDWCCKNTEVKRLLTPNEINEFVNICKKHGAVLRRLIIMPNYGWWHEIETGTKLNLDLDNDIESFTKRLSKQ